MTDEEREAKFKDRAEKARTRMDANGDGKVSYDEVKNAQGRMRTSDDPGGDRLRTTTATSRPDFQLRRGRDERLAASNSVHRSAMPKTACSAPARTPRHRRRRRQAPEHTNATAP